MCFATVPHGKISTAVGTAVAAVWRVVTSDGLAGVLIEINVFWGQSVLRLILEYVIETNQRPRYEPVV